LVRNIEKRIMIEQCAIKKEVIFGKEFVIKQDIL